MPCQQDGMVEMCQLLVLCLHAIMHDGPARPSASHSWPPTGCNDWTTSCSWLRRMHTTGHKMDKLAECFAQHEVGVSATQQDTTNDQLATPNPHEWQNHPAAPGCDGTMQPTEQWGADRMNGRCLLGRGIICPPKEQMMNHDEHPHQENEDLQREFPKI